MDYSNDAGNIFSRKAAIKARMDEIEKILDEGFASRKEEEELGREYDKLVNAFYSFRI